MRNFLGVGVGGYYDPATENITVVSVTENALYIRETTLAQELYPAQQDQQFGLSEEFDTVEERNAANSLVEGDANYVEYLYEKRCEHEWNGSCYLPQPPERDQSAQNLTVNPGMVQIFLQPYNSGIAFVREHHRSEGWAAVDELYENPPVSTEQAIHPDAYPEDEPANLTVTDRSTDAWQPVTQDGDRLHGSVGEAGLFVALWYPAFETHG